MQVIAAGQTGHAAPSDRLAAADAVADVDVERRKMPVERLHAHPVVDDHAVAVDAEPARVEDGAGVGRDDRDVARDGEIEPKVHLVVDVLALVDVGSVVGKRRFHFRVTELHERTVPESRGRRAFGECGNLIGVPAAQLAVDLEKRGNHVGAGRRRGQLQLG